MDGLLIAIGFALGGFVSGFVAGLILYSGWLVKHFHRMGWHVMDKDGSQVDMFSY